MMASLADQYSLLSMRSRCRSEAMLRASCMMPMRRRSVFMSSPILSLPPSTATLGHATVEGEDCVVVEAEVDTAGVGLGSAFAGAEGLP